MAGAEEEEECREEEQVKGCEIYTLDNLDPRRYLSVYQLRRRPQKILSATVAESLSELQSGWKKPLYRTGFVVGTISPHNDQFETRITRMAVE